MWSRRPTVCSTASVFGADRVAPGANRCTDSPLSRIGRGGYCALQEDRDPLARGSFSCHLGPEGEGPGWCGCGLFRPRVVLSTQVVRACAGRTTSWSHKVHSSCDRGCRKFPGSNCCGAVRYLLACTVHAHGSVPKANIRRRCSYKSIFDPVLTRVAWLLLGKECHAAEKTHRGSACPPSRRGRSPRPTTPPR